MLETIYNKYTQESYDYFSFLMKRKSFWKKQRFQFCKFVITHLVYLIVKYWKRPSVSASVKSDLIVSLTSFPGRIDSIWFTLESLIRQTVRPSKIVLYLSKNEFDFQEKELPVFLREYRKYGLEVVWVDVNLRSHNKYFYVLKDYREHNVVTIDDDLFYPSDTLSRLLSLQERYAQTICANITRKIDKETFWDYSKWGKTPGYHKCGASQSLVALGYGAVLYPKTFRPNCLFDVEGIKECAFYADDLWLKAVEYFVGFPVVTGEYFAPPLTTPFSQRIALQKKNCNGENRNNSQWRKLVDRFELDKLFFNRDSE